MCRAQCRNMLARAHRGERSCRRRPGFPEWVRAPGGVQHSLQKVPETLLSSASHAETYFVYRQESTACDRAAVPAPSVISPVLLGLNNLRLI